MLKTLSILGAVIIAAGIFVLVFTGPKSATAPASQTPQTVTLYLYDATRDTDEAGTILCSERGLVGVERSIPASENIIRDTLTLLMTSAVNDADTAHGLTSEFPLEGLSMTELSLQDGNLALTFEDPLHKTSGGSCRSTILWKQIEATAKQFPEVREVLFAPQELFQP